jgi:hypothetical protein
MRAVQNPLTGVGDPQAPGISEKAVITLQSPRILLNHTGLGRRFENTEGKTLLCDFMSYSWEEMIISIQTETLLLSPASNQIRDSLAFDGYGLIAR